MSNTNHDFLVKNGLVVGQAITSTGTLTQAGQTFPASDGSAGQYLKTNGSGALSWGTVNTSFNITDGTTTDTVGSTETVTFTGGTNISLAVTDNTVTITNDVVDSDDITEGSSNLFYTDARAIAAIQGASNLTIDGGTLYVDTAADRVGISDTSPQQKLDVAGNIGVNGSEVIDASGNIVGSVADSAMTVGGSLAGVLSNLKVQYGTAYSGTPIQGSFFFDSLNQKLKVYTGSAFIDAVPAGSGGGGGGGATDANTTFRNYSYTLTGTTSAVSGVDDNELTAGAFIIGHKYTITSVGNTDFTAIGASGNTVGVVFTATGVGSGTGQAKQTLFYDTTSSATRVVAYVNGIKQVYGSGRDFVATTGTSVAFTYNLGSGDTVDIQVYELLTNAAYYVKSEVYTQTEVNSQISTGVSAYLPLAGGTMTGDLTVTGANTHLDGRNSAGLTLDLSGTGHYTIKESTTNDIIKLGGTGTSNFISHNISSGNVGIGTDNPAEKLEVNGSIKVGNLKIQNEHGGRIGFNRNTANGAIYDSSYAAFQINGATSTLDYLSFEAYPVSGSASNAMSIKSNGNVGIGTTGPNESLHIYRASGDASFKVQSASQTLRIDQNSIRTTTNSPLAMFTNSTSTQGFRIENDGRMIIGHTGGQTNVKLTVAGNVKMGSAATSSWANTINDIGGLDIIVGSGSTGLTVWDDNAQSTPRFKVTRAGDVGIGTSSPLGRLHLKNAIAGASHTYSYDGNGITVESDEPTIQIVAQDSGTHGGSLLWRYGDNLFAANANPTTDNLEFISGVTTGNDFNVHAGTNVTSYKKTLVIGADGNVSIQSGQLVLSNLSSNPTSPVTGGMYYNTTTNLAYVYNGSTWNQISNVPFGATGGTETTYSSGGNNYKVHTFTSSGTFTALGVGDVDVLIVAGGGGGGTCNTSEQGGGGGGAGGFITSSGTSGRNTSAISSITVQPQSYTVTVGSGGTGGAFAEDQPGTQGGNSSVFGITAIGGGGGGGNATEGQSGGCGGGGKESNGVGRSGTAGQGFGGGAGSETDDRGGGGGGAGQAGQNYNAGSRSAGGNGLANSIRTGSAVNYAGGGGGGGTRLGVAIGGAGGGGGAGVAGAANTGGGGGSDTASVSSTKGQNGGSGIIVIRYQV